MKQFFLNVLVLMLFNNMVFSQNFTIFKVGQSKTYHVGSAEQLGPHFSYIGTTTNYVRVTALSSGTGTIINRSGNLEHLKCVDVVNISIAENLSLTSGESYTYSPVITDVEAETTLTWNSDNSGVADVDGNGTVKANGIGIATITCTAENGVKAQSIVTVFPLKVSSVTLNKNSYEMSVGGTYSLTATISPDNTTNKTVKWFSSNENIAQVDDNGKVTAIGSGYCSIYAKADDGSGKFDKCLIHVTGTAGSRSDVNGDGVVTVTDAEVVIDEILSQP